MRASLLKPPTRPAAASDPCMPPLESPAAAVVKLSILQTAVITIIPCINYQMYQRNCLHERGRQVALETFDIDVR